MICFLALCLAIVQQPAGEPLYVSQDYTVTQYRAADSWYLAHNYLAGERFGELQVGDEVRINGVVYRVGEVLSFQVANLRTYISGGVRYSERQVFEMLRHRVVLQTCIKKGENPSWGRLFVLLTRVVYPRMIYRYL